jgi:lipopolysaccharide export system permease protein
MSLLYGTVQTFSELSSKGEVTALWAGGMSLKRMLRAPLIWGAVLAVLTFSMEEWVVPQSEMKMSEVLSRRAREAMSAQEEFSFRDPPQGALKRVIQAERFDPKTNTLTQPRVQFYRDLGVYMQITAQRGQWDEDTGKWKFVRGKIETFPSGQQQEGGAFLVSNFEEIQREDVAAPSSLQRATTTLQYHLNKRSFEKVSIRDLIEYRQELMAQQKAAATSEKDPEAPTVTEIQQRIKGATFSMNDKIATPLICVALILVGVPLGLRPQRSSGGFSLGLSLVVILIYYLTWQFANNLGKYGQGNPYILAYLAPALTTLIGMTLVWQKNR